MDQCALTQYSAIEADIILRGNTILFYGDSLLRQLFLRLVWHLRGFGEIMEHYFHAHAIYVRNTTHDYLYVGPEDETGTRHFSLDKEGKNFIYNPTFQLIFLWEPRLEDPDHVELQFQRAKNTFKNFTLITGVHYWLEPGEFRPKVIPRQIQRFQNKYPDIRLVWYPIPNGLYWKRNRFYESFVNTSRSWVFPSEAMANTSAYTTNTADQKHYMCAFLKHLEYKIILNDFKTPASGDCRDIFNYNLVQILLNILAHESIA
jgi:hypothetical protein